MTANNLFDQLQIADHLGCFGNFMLNDPICRKYCAIKIRCLIEREHNSKLELWQDLAEYDTTLPKPQ